MHPNPEYPSEQRISRWWRALAPALLLIALCPDPAQAVVGGNEVQHPRSWIASVQQPSGAHVCTASLIASQWVLTAFHCTLAGDGLQVRVGSLNRTHGGHLVKVAQTYPHPDAWYDPQTHRFGGTDLALLKLEHPLPNTPIGLARHSPAVGASLRAMGWGYTCFEDGCELPERLREITVPRSTTGACDVGDRPLICLRDNQKGASAGDSGGPLLARTRRGPRLTGVTSGGGQDVDTGEYISVYQDLTAHLDWIRSTAGLTGSAAGGSAHGRVTGATGANQPGEPTGRSSLISR